MDNLYKIRDPQGRCIPFRLNWAQRRLFEGLHTCNIVLKARQIGITTFYCIYLLDQVLWNRNVQAGIIAHNREDAQNFFADKIKFALDHLHPAIRQQFQTVGDSASELAFKHDSVIRVGTSLRSSTLQYLHISEFGKICSKFPEKAREIVTGALNTVHVGQSISIESTAEGREGYFFDFCNEAKSQEGQRLGPLEFKLFFFPWWEEPTYRLTGGQELLYVQSKKPREEEPISMPLIDLVNQRQNTGPMQQTPGLNRSFGH